MARWATFWRVATPKRDSLRSRHRRCKRGSLGQIRRWTGSHSAVPTREQARRVCLHTGTLDERCASIPLYQVESGGTPAQRKFRCRGTPSEWSGRCSRGRAFFLAEAGRCAGMPPHALRDWWPDARKAQRCRRLRECASIPPSSVPLYRCTLSRFL